MFPFQALKCLGETGLEKACFPGGIDYSSTTEFEHVSIERRLEGRRLESTPDQGWAFYEIDKVDQAAGGSPRAHVDAVKLLAVVIAHWDNKAENQRLLCLPGGDLPDGGCARPYAILQDLGASFGPTKLDLHNWRSTPVWADARACRVSMKHLPWGGATFPEQRISEEGRCVPVVAAASSCHPRNCGTCSPARAWSCRKGITAEGRRRPLGGGVSRQGAAGREAGPCGRHRSKLESSLQGQTHELLHRGSEACLCVGVSPRFELVSVCDRAYVPGREITPASTVSPVRLMAWKYSSLPDTSISMK